MDTNNNIDLNFPPNVLQDVFRRQTITCSPFHLHPYFYDFMDECLSLYFIFILLYMVGEINFSRIQTSNGCQIFYLNEIYHLPEIDIEGSLSFDLHNFVVFKYFYFCSK